ncbi:DUF1638 domain-containing protein [Alkalibaculum bacchi]|uniref:DUF1638 domain-containing protein n=1 Tax=Alkalibaculum bacchi TaxID=645887 RepID=UPI0026ED45A2|nr:DUF1638 domain-containing protein [Alkalibaculum bacchi]
MNNLLIVCETIQDEIEKVTENIGFTGDMIWMNASLHNEPNCLRSELQKVIDSHIGYDNILLGYGSCGNSIIGLKATHTSIVFPVTADCISMLLCDYQNIDYIRKNTYFLTKGWINGEKSIFVEYKYCLEKYGEKRAKRIFSAMLKHYENLMLIDTKTYDMDYYGHIVQDLANKTNLRFIVEEGSLSILERLLSGKWDESFGIIKPGEEIVYKHFGKITGDEMSQSF